MNFTQNIRNLFRNRSQEKLVSNASPKKHNERKTAVFIDIENFETAQNIDVLFGKIKYLTQKEKVSIFAYADWKRIDAHIIKFLKENSVEMKDAHNGYGYYAYMKNSADIALSCDVVELALTDQELDHFILATGDSGFINLIYKLKDYGKHVSLISIESKTSKALVEKVDEFHYIKDFGIGFQNPIKLEFNQAKQSKEYSRLERTLWAILKKNENNHNHVWITEKIFNATAVQQELLTGLDIKTITGTIKVAYAQMEHKRASLINLVNMVAQRDYVKKDGLFYTKGQDNAFV
jgi:uncharacterized LabA/DUF88 family protein